MHFLFESSGNLPAECHGLVFFFSLSVVERNCRHLVSAAALHTIMTNMAAVCLSAGREDGGRGLPAAFHSAADSSVT